MAIEDVETYNVDLEEGNEYTLPSTLQTKTEYQKNSMCFCISYLFTTLVLVIFIILTIYIPANVAICPYACSFVCETNTVNGKSCQSDFNTHCDFDTDMDRFTLFYQSGGNSSCNEYVVGETYKFYPGCTYQSFNSFVPTDEFYQNQQSIYYISDYVKVIQFVIFICSLMILICGMVVYFQVFC